MSLLDQPHWATTIATWQHHQTHHDPMLPDRTCIFCDDNPRWQPGGMWDYRNRKGER